MQITKHVQVKKIFRALSNNSACGLQTFVQIQMNVWLLMETALKCALTPMEATHALVKVVMH